MSFTQGSVAPPPAPAGGARGVRNPAPVRAAGELGRIDAAALAAPFDAAPVTVAWEVTRACPLRCAHCRADAQPRRDPHELTTLEGIGLVRQVADLGAKVLVLTGGDPFLRLDLNELVAAAEEAGLYVGLSPSVTARLTPERLARAVAAGAGTVHVSLDGACAATHDGLRGVAGSFTKTLAAIEAVLALGTRLQVGTTVTRRVLQELPAVAEMLRGRASSWTLFFLVPTGRATSADLLSAEEVERVLAWLVTLDADLPVRTIEAPMYRRVLATAGRPVPPPVGAGRGFCFVSHRGDVCPSGFLPLSAGNVRRTSLADLYRNSPLFRSLRDTSLLEGRCGRCEFRDICGGSRSRAFALTGDLFAEDPACAYVPRPVPARRSAA